MADGAAGTSDDVDLRVTTTLDTLQLDDGSLDTPFGGSAPSVAGTPLTGVSSFLRLSHFSPTGQMEPYRLYSVIQPSSASASPEIEPNDAIGQASTSPANYAAGALASGADVDLYSFTLPARTLVYIGLDADPLRNGTPFNAALDL